MLNEMIGRLSPYDKKSEQNKSRCKKLNKEKEEGPAKEKGIRPDNS